MYKWLTSVLGWIAGRIFMKDWFLSIGAMCFPVGITLITLNAVSTRPIPVAVYYLGFVLGCIGLFAFFFGLRKAFMEDVERKEQKKQTDKDIQSVKKVLDSIHGDIEGLRGDMKKWKQ
jgi:hypothetical protein